MIDNDLNGKRVAYARAALIGMLASTPMTDRTKVNKTCVGATGLRVGRGDARGRGRPDGDRRLCAATRPVMCEHVKVPGGLAIICGGRRGRRPPCLHCGDPAEFECDGPPPEGSRRKTCDRPLCRRCRIHVPPDRDYCKAHREQAKLAGAQLRLFNEGDAYLRRVK